MSQGKEELTHRGSSVGSGIEGGRGFHSEEGGHPLERFDWRHDMIFFFKDGDKIHLT